MELRHVIGGDQGNPPSRQPMMTQSSLEKPLHLDRAEGIRPSPRTKIHLDRQPRPARIPQGHLGRHIITPAQKRLHPRSYFHFPFLFPAGQDVGQERPHFSFPRQSITLRRPLPGKKACGQKLTLCHPLHLATPNPIPLGIPLVRNPGIHSLVLTRHPSEDVGFVSINSFQLAAHPGKQSVQFYPDLWRHGLKLEIFQSFPGLHPHMPLQLRHLSLQEGGQALPRNRSRSFS